jgi:glycosyltransferase involved in cell wall biosynthesis
MKVVLMHDWLTGFRGGERVLEAFCELFPDAPIVTLIHKRGSVPPSIEKHAITTSFLNKIPGIHEQYRKFLPLFPRAAESLVLPDDVDLVLSSSHCVIKGVKKPAKAVHVSYLHSPMRYLYDQYDNYFGPDAPIYQRAGMKLVRGYLTNWDKASNANVDVMIANSGFVKERIKNFYGIDSGIIHPFVDLADFEDIKKSPPAKENYYCMVTAFAPNKRVDLAIKAFNQMEKRLVIIGSGQQEEMLKAMAGKTIEFLGNVDRATVMRTLAKSRALIFPGVEDFGITPLEALAAGTPVIAFKAGGVLETLSDKVAQFFDSPETESLVDAVSTFEQRQFQRDDLISRANDFSKESFKAKILEVVQNALGKKI